MNKSPIQGLSNELLKLILDHVEPHPDNTVPIDKRQFLSVESFHRPPPSRKGSLRDIGNFRRANKRFAAVGEQLLFTRVSARFSQRGLEKLETLASWPHLARHVKKFSYLVPYFYSDDASEGRIRLPAQRHLGLDSRTLQRKAREQRELRESGRDVEVLKKAIKSFVSLQLVQLLRVTDGEDEKLLTYLRQHHDGEINAAAGAAVAVPALAPAAGPGEGGGGGAGQAAGGAEGDPALPQLMDWAPACLHGSRTIGLALLAADSVPWSRFSSPMLSPQSAEFLASHAPLQLPALAARLTCLALHFDDGHDLDQKMTDLSGLFRTVFTTARSMQAIHLGFPAHRPLSLPLEDVFHGVTWEKLVAFGVQGWNLHADEILNLVLRHRDRLKGLRLRDVRLKEGSLWKNVLGTLRASMYKLEWVSLRRIDYVQHFEDAWVGVEIPDDPPPTQSDSDSDSEEDEDEPPAAGPSNGSNRRPRHFDDESSEDEDESSDDNHDDDDNEYDDDDDSDDDDTDSYHGRNGDANDMDFPALESPITPAAPSWCNCSGGDWLSSADDMEDDGYSVSNAKRRLWERWVVRRCQEHDL